MRVIRFENWYLVITLFIVVSDRSVLGLAKVGQAWPADLGRNFHWVISESHPAKAAFLPKVGLRGAAGRGPTRARTARSRGLAIEKIANMGSAAPYLYRKLVGTRSRLFGRQIFC